MKKFDEIEQYVRGFIFPGFRNVFAASAVICVCGAGLAGWIMNIGALFSSRASWWEFGLRLIAIPFWPLGAILGWL
jgi:hypothetical protein